MTTVEAASSADPGLSVSPSNSPSFKRWLAQKLYPHFIRGKVWLPPFFYLSMNAPIDPRLDKLAQGLGVIIVETPRGGVSTQTGSGDIATPRGVLTESRGGVGVRAKFYPIRTIPAGGLEDDWHGRVLHVWRGKLDGAPQARWLDTGEEPMQLLSRWYGFSFTYPGCEVYEKAGDRG